MSVSRRSACALACSLLLAASCRACEATPPEPAGRRELELLKEALRPGAYPRAIAELEKTPEAGLRAVREQSAKPGTREALFLAMIEDRLEHVEDHRRWRERFKKAAEPGPISQLGPKYEQHISELDARRHVYFWTEQLLAVGGEMEHVAAIRHLERIGGDVAALALAIDVRTPEGSHNFQGQAGLALARMGRGREVADGIAAWQQPNVAPTMRPGSVEVLKQALRKLEPEARAKTETALLVALEREKLSSEQRSGYLQALAVTGTSGSLARLVALRRGAWGKQHKAEIDAAVAAILQRGDDRKSKPP
jgi:hypothetical protein